MEHAVINNEQLQRFEIPVDGQIALLEYRLRPDEIVLVHTEVPESLSGQGLASALAHHGFEWAKAHELKVIVYCPFVAGYLKRHPEYESMVVKK
jgi:uncharacterized protein